MSPKKETPRGEAGSDRPKADPDWLKRSDAILRRAAQQPSPRFRITEGQRRALRSS